MEPNPDHKPETDDLIPKNAILVLEGVKVHPLTEAVINIGRKLENHIIIDDPRISRQHAQLRAVNGHFMLFDLNSTGGTFVNGKRTSQILLYPGDVISLAGVTLVFTEDDPTSREGQVETSPLGAGQRPTPTMEKSTLDVKMSGGKTQKPRDATQGRGVDENDNLGI